MMTVPEVRALKVGDRVYWMGNPRIMPLADGSPAPLNVPGGGVVLATEKRRYQNRRFRAVQIQWDDMPAGGVPGWYYQDEFEFIHREVTA